MGEIFIRTPSGLANSHLFHSADLIVYCESHPDRPAEMSWDLGFWSKIVSYFAPEHSFVLKPLGGKGAVLAVADGLKDASKHHSLCMVDRDFSDIHLDSPQVDYVIETYGYAFENDLCTDDVISSAVDFLMPGYTDLSKIRTDVSKLRQETENSFRWSVVADVLLSFYYRSLFDRDEKKYKSVCDFSTAYDNATLHQGRALNRLVLQRSSINAWRIARPKIPRIDVWRRMLGHLCWWLNFRIATKLMRDYGFKDRISEDTFAATCLSFFSIKLGDTNWNIRQYYEVRMAKGILAAT